MQTFYSKTGVCTALSAITAILAITLQTQLTLFAHGDYPGLRINAADFLLPLAGLAVIISLISGKSHWPRWNSPWLQPALFSLFVAITTALYIGYTVNGGLTQWALINKYIGFIILCAYFFLGGWIATNHHGPRVTTRIFAQSFTAFTTFILLASAISLLVEPVIGTDLPLTPNQWPGLMANSNSFALTVLLALILILTYSHAQETVLPEWINRLFFILYPLFLTYNASRVGWLCSALILITFLIKSPRYSIKTVLPCMAAATLFLVTIYQIPAYNRTFQGDNLHHLTSIAKQDIVYEGDQKRLIAIEDGLELYAASNPVTGAGLGTYQSFQIEKRGEFIDIIDFTALWFLTEMGLWGLLSLIAFFALALHTLLQKSRRDEGNIPYTRAILFFLIAMAAISLLHEILYTRFLWFAAGLALASPQTKHKIPGNKTFYDTTP